MVVSSVVTSHFDQGKEEEEGKRKTEPFAPDVNQPFGMNGKEGYRNLKE